MSKKTLKLYEPILINGKMVSELTYDALKISVDQFLDAAAQASASERSSRVSVKAMANDWSFHLHLGFSAIIAENPDIDIEDLKRMHGYDILNVADIGWLFTLRRLEGPSEQNGLDPSCETTQEPSTQE